MAAFNPRHIAQCKINLNNAFVQPLACRHAANSLCTCLLVLFKKVAGKICIFRLLLVKTLSVTMLRLIWNECYTMTANLHLMCNLKAIYVKRADNQQMEAFVYIDYFCELCNRKL